TAGQLGQGMQCYDAETLELLWYQDSVLCSSHCIALVDVNKDGILDAVAMQQSGGGIYTVDGATWDKMPGKWQNSISGLGTHSQFSIFDIDNDENLELIASSDNPTEIWDMGRWALDATLDKTAEPPKMADVIGDSHLEIIVTAANVIKIYNGTYELVETINTDAIAHTLVQDIDNDGQNELIIITDLGVLKAYDTSAYAPTPRVRTNNQFYSERANAAGVYVPPAGAPQPIIKTVSPLDNAQDVSLTPKLCAHVIDFHYDLMNITISTNATGSWVDLASYHNVGNAWYNITTATMNQKNTTYYWRVTATDPYADKMTTTKTYRFTTLASPKITSIIATPSTILSGKSVNITCDVTDGTTVNTVKVNITAPNGQKTNMTASGGSPGWKVLKYDNFESGIGNYTIGGSSCSLYTGSTYSYQGTKAVKIQDYQGMSSSFYLTQPIDVDTPRYTSLKVDFWFKAHGMADLTNFWVKFYDGQHWRIVDNYIKPGSQGYRPSDKPFNNDVFTHGVTWINETKYTFPTNMKIRFECDAPSSSYTVYIDQVYINATTAQGPNYYYNNTYTQEGTYQYYIWAKDTSGNSIKSDVHTFQVVSNTATLTVNTFGNGTVAINPNKPTYTYGEIVTLTAVPTTDYIFDYWSGDLTGSTNPVQIMMAGNKIINAYFTLKNYTLTVNSIGNGTVIKNPNKTTYHNNDTVLLTATTANPDWSFVGWSGNLSGTTNPITITIHSDTVITAHFLQTKWLTDWQYRKSIIVNKQVENCRMYAAVADNLPDGMLLSDLSTQPYSLKNLATTAYGNVDGWGVAYYTDYNQSLTVKRGAEKASTDVDYDNIVSLINTLEPKIILAHIRHCTSGCCAHGSELYENPHPFVKVKNGVKFTFMHNGGVNVALTKSLIGSAYLAANPLNCSSVCGDDQNCDTEVYFTLLLKHIQANSWDITKGLIE
ncbi:MAG: class II glutamine amidotransferase, partial [Euryarchaeota archaeon]|nr:class II glutamine amidotransferase [Euryarchaeota archaeon]